MKYRLTALTLALLSCPPAFSEGFPNEPRQANEFISKSHPELGRLTTIEVLGDYIIAIPEIPSAPDGSDFEMRAIDISDPENPVTVATFGRTTHPVLAHGAFKKYNELYLGGNPNSAIRLEEDGSLSHVPFSYIRSREDYGKSSVSYPWNATTYWSYNPLETTSKLWYRDELQAEWDHLGLTGVIGFPTIIGNILLYGSDQTRTGVAAYDISDPTNPQLLDVLKLPSEHPTLERPIYGSGGIVGSRPLEYGLGGYWYEITGHYMTFARRGENPGVQIVDFSDPSNLRLHCEVFFRDDSRGIPYNPSVSPMYVGFQDEYVFAEQLKINVETCEVSGYVDKLAAEIEVSQYSRPIGNLLLTGGGHNYILEGDGIRPGGLGIFAHQDAPDTRPPYVSYHLPADGQTDYPLTAPITLLIPETLHATTILPGQTITVTEVGGEEIAIDYVLSHTGQLTVASDEPFKPNTTYEVHLEGIEDAVHNQMEPYTFRFTTVGTYTPEPPVIGTVSLSPTTDIAVGADVTVSAQATDPNGETLEYRFRRSDGAEYSTWSSSSSITYQYELAGNYNVSVQVRNTSGESTTTVQSVSVVSGYSSEGSKLRSRQMALSTAGDVIWVVNPDNDTISKVSTSDHSLIGEYEIGASPQSVAIDQNGLAWVTLEEEDSIALIDSSGAIQDRVRLQYGSGPWGIVMNESGSTAYVGLYRSGQVVQIDVDTRDITGVINNLNTPKAMALTEDGSRLLVTRFISPQNWGEVYDINTTSMSSSTIRLDQSLIPDNIDNGRGVPNHLSGIVLDGDNRFAYVVGKKDNNGRGLVNGNDDIDDDNTVRTFAAMIDLASSSEIVSSRIDFDNADSPSSITLSDDGLYAFVTLQGNNKVAVLNRNATNGGLGNPVSNFPTGLAPQELLLDGESQQLFVKNFTGRSVSSIDLEPFLAGSLVNPPTETTPTVTSEKLSASELLGKQIFYNAALGLEEEEAFLGRMSAEGYLSCATCHLNGESDHRVYDFTGRGEGLRNNISLVGRMGARFGDMHWSGNFDEVHDFENDIRLNFRGRGLMTDEQFEATMSPQGPLKSGLSENLDALSDYVSSLGKESLSRSPHRDNIGELTTEGLLGQQVFQDLGCQECHRGKAFTDGVIHNVGTLRSHSGQRLGQELPGIKTPSLLGVFETAPYLHDGSANTLEDVFSILGGDVYQAEAATLEGGASVITPDFSYMRDGAGVLLPEGGTITVSADSQAHSGSIRVRYGSVSAPTQLNVSVNGTVYSRPLEILPMVETEHVAFLETVLSVELSAGSNAVSISIDSADGDSVVIDEVTVSSALNAQFARGHRSFLVASASDKANLIEYLKQIDTRSAPEDDEPIVLGIIQSPQEPVDETDTGNQTPTDDSTTDPVQDGTTENEVTDNPSDAEEPTQEEVTDTPEEPAIEEGTTSGESEAEVEDTSNGPTSNGSNNNAQTSNGSNSGVDSGEESGGGSNGPLMLLLLGLLALSLRKRNKQA